jgi:hypothetical protein
MKLNGKHIAIGLGALVVGAIILSTPQCKGLLRAIGTQLESVGVSDIVSGFFG